MKSTIRQEIVSHVNAAFVAQFPGVPIVYDNQPFDWNNPPETFVEFEVKFYGGHQISMSATPKTRHTGYVYATVYGKVGSGNKLILEIIDWMSSHLGYAQLANTSISAPESDDLSGPVKNWYAEAVKFSFQADET